MSVSNLDRKTKDKIYQILFEYRVLTQAAQLNIARGHTSYDGLECYQSTLDAKVANDIFEAIKELKLKTIEDWYYDLIGYRSADFCVGDSGIPKYPKSWSKNEN